MGRTHKFIKNSQSIVQLITQGKVSPEFLDIHLSFSKGLCFVCKKRFLIRDVIKTGSGIEYQFDCGHGLTIINLQEADNLGEGYSNSRVGVNEDGDHEVRVQKGGVRPGKEADEMVVAKVFAHFAKPDLTIFYHDVEKSPYDVIAESSDGGIKYYFQITRLEDKEFWQSLNTKNVIETIIPKAHSLTEQAIQKKMRYEPEVRQKITLLIDVEPGVVEETAKKIKKSLNSFLENSGFKEIWLVGSTSELIHRIL